MQSETQSKKNLWTDGPAISHKKRFPVCQILFLPCFRLTFVTSLFLYGDTHEKCLFLRRRLWLRPLADTEDSRGT